EDRQPNSGRSARASAKAQRHRRRARQRSHARDRACERSTIKGAGERRMRPSDGNLQRNGTASRQRRTLGSNNPFLAANVRQRTRRRLSPRSPRPGAWKLMKLAAFVSVTLAIATTAFGTKKSEMQSKLKEAQKKFT